MLAVRLEENPYVRKESVREPLVRWDRKLRWFFLFISSKNTIVRSLALERTRKRYDMYPVCGQIDSACLPPV